MIKWLLQDLKTIRIARNWVDIVSAFHTSSSVTRIELRNGFTFEAPEAGNLLFIFSEIFTQEVYKIYPFEGKIIDIGANVGMFSAYALRDGVTIEAYEPFPDSAACFRRTFQDIPNVVLHQKAVAGMAGKRGLRKGANWGMHSLSEGDEVETVTLDSILPCDLLKIDCEGGEYEILFNSSLNFKRIVGEYHDLDADRTGKRLRDFLESNGFRIDVFEPCGSTGMIAAERIHQE
ncbi:MAG: FkbM family methyltransferase [Acidobacteria bacterium]|nr:FkbM family methyltransferase [Acidobacteriota bacterium]